MNNDHLPSSACTSEPAEALTRRVDASNARLICSGNGLEQSWAPFRVGSVAYLTGALTRA